MTERDWAKDWETCKKATHGPWIVRKANGRPGVWLEGRVKIASVEAPDFPPVLENEGRLRNATFIAEAREGWPAALEWVKKLEEENRRLWAIFKTCPGCSHLVAGDLFGCCHQDYLDGENPCNWYEREGI